MDYSVFVQRAVEQDGRNVFTKYDGDLAAVPEQLNSFYRSCNPSDVEINSGGVPVRFFSAEELPSLQREYSHLHAQFIFATCNGDPIFLHEGCVYTCPHGVKEPEWELLSGDFETYLSSLV